MPPLDTEKKRVKDELKKVKKVHGGNLKRVHIGPDEDRIKLVEDAEAVLSHDELDQYERLTDGGLEALGALDQILLAGEE